MRGRSRWLIELFSRLPSSRSLLAVGAAGVEVELAVDGVAEVSFQRRGWLPFGFAVGDCAVDVGPSLGVG